MVSVPQAAVLSSLTASTSFTLASLHDTERSGQKEKKAGGEVEPNFSRKTHFIAFQQ